jgi:heptosyltransferase-2
MATPGLRAFRMANPEAWIVAQLPAPLMPLLDGIGVCDEIWPIEPSSAGLAALRSEARRVVDGAFDLGILIPESISSALRMRCGRVGRIVGFARDPVRRVLLHEVVPAPASWGRRRLVSRERFVTQLMGALGASTDDLTLHLHVGKAEQAELDRVLSGLGLPADEIRCERRIVLAPGAGFGDSKCWPAEYYAELADRFVERGDQVIVLGGPEEGALLEAVRGAMRSTPILLDASLDLGGLKALLHSARLLVANDAGTRHVAAAFGTPSVIFLGPTSLEKTADNLDRVEVVERDHDCRPCYQRQCPIDHRCLRLITVDDADSAATRILDRVRQQRVAKPNGLGVGTLR